MQLQLNRHHVLQGKTKDLGNEREQEVRALAPQDGRKKSRQTKKAKNEIRKIETKRYENQKKNAKQSKAKRSETKTRSHFGFRLSRSKAADKGGHNRKAIINK